MKKFLDKIIVLIFIVFLVYLFTSPIIMISISEMETKKILKNPGIVVDKYTSIEDEKSNVIVVDYGDREISFTVSTSDYEKIEKGQQFYSNQYNIISLKTKKYDKALK